MKIEKFVEGEKLIIKIEGELEISQSKILEQELIDLPEEVKELVFDLDKLEYSASAGLRIFLLANKMMKTKNGKFRLINVNENVYEIIRMASLTQILNPEKK